MNEDYLWDRCGEPQPEIAHLERILEDLRWSSKLPDLSAEPPAMWWRHKQLWAMAATVLAVSVGMTLLVQRTRSPGAITSWQLSFAGQKPKPVTAGQVIETAGAHAIMQSEFIGELNIEPYSRLRMLTPRQDQHRLALDHGTIHAFIWAPPTKFIVDTPGANAVDLGCQYTLSVERDGKGLLTVETGWVAFQWKKIESFIPEGAACTTRVGYGPDPPYFLDAPEALTNSLTEFDRTGSEAALRSILAAARPRDALTLWHLLERTQGRRRAEVFDRFAELVRLPSSVTRESILRSDRTSMDAAWDALKLGNTSWWREWKRNW